MTHLIPGAPITRKQLQEAVKILGFDPEHVTSFEVGGNRLEAAHGHAIYSQHPIVDHARDPWAAPAVLVVDLAGMKHEHVQVLKRTIEQVKAALPHGEPF